MGKEPNYACPHIDAVLDPLKEVFQSMQNRFGKQTLAELEEVHEVLLLLKDSAERELERVRSICEELREGRHEFELELQNVTTQFENLSEEHDCLKKEYDELKALYEHLQEGE